MKAFFPSRVGWVEVIEHIYGSQTPDYVVKDLAGNVIDTFSNYNDAYDFFVAQKRKEELRDRYWSWMRRNTGRY